jgi:hypothetical protein
VWLKSSVPLSCAYTDNLGLTLDWRRRFRVRVECGISLSHWWSGNYLSVEQIPARM